MCIGDSMNRIGMAAMVATVLAIAGMAGMVAAQSSTTHMPLAGASTLSNARSGANVQSGLNVQSGPDVQSGLNVQQVGGGPDTAETVHAGAEIDN